jgi:hypothetical protein
MHVNGEQVLFWYVTGVTVKRPRPETASEISVSIWDKGQIYACERKRGKFVAGPGIEPGTPALLVAEQPRPISHVNQSLSLLIPDEPLISVTIAKVKRPRPEITY